MELTVGFESNLSVNAARKKDKYKEIVKILSSKFKEVIFVNLSISALGVFAKESENFITMLDDLGYENNFKQYIIKTIIKIAIRSTYFIFCRRNKDWESPDFIKY